MPLPVAIKDAVLAEVGPADHEIELLPEEGVERVSDADRGGQFSSATSSWFGGRRRA